jgi:formylglycine-generating enzyme required for sulfatase activity
LPDGRRVETAGRNWRNPGFAQQGREPVACVSWDDAQAYAQWLNVKTGKQYRLLSEAEWEYAARAGTATARHGSDDPVQLCRYISGGDIDYTQAYPGDTDVNRSCHDGYARSSPVGAFPPNGFGLYDMLGNLLEWTEDCGHDNYVGAPSDGSAWTAGDCGKRALRSGSWTNGPRSLRAAYRDWQAASYRTSRLGFRVARSN